MTKPREGPFTGLKMLLRQSEGDIARASTYLEHIGTGAENQLEEQRAQEACGPGQQHNSAVEGGGQLQTSPCTRAKASDASHPSPYQAVADWCRDRQELRGPVQAQRHGGPFGSDRFGKYQRTRLCVRGQGYEPGRRWSCCADRSLGFWLLVGSVHAHVGQCRHCVQLVKAVEVAGAAERRGWEVHHLHGLSPRTVGHPELKFRLLEYGRRPSQGHSPHIVISQLATKDGNEG